MKYIINRKGFSHSVGLSPQTYLEVKVEFSCTFSKFSKKVPTVFVLVLSHTEFIDLSLSKHFPDDQNGHALGNVSYQKFILTLWDHQIGPREFSLMQIHPSFMCQLNCSVPRVGDKCVCCVKIVNQRNFKLKCKIIAQITFNL